MVVLGGNSPRHVVFRQMNKECVEVIVLVGHLETLNALLSIHDSAVFFLVSSAFTRS